MGAAILDKIIGSAIAKTFLWSVMVKPNKVDGTMLSLALSNVRKSGYLQKMGV